MSVGRLASFVVCARAASATEFAILALPLLLLVFGIMEYGRLMWTREALQQTAIAGARCMGMTQTACGSSGVYSASMTTSYIQSQAQGWGLQVSSANISLNQSATCAGLSGFSTVGLTYTFTTLLPGFITALAQGGGLVATACFPNHS